MASRSTSYVVVKYLKEKGLAVIPPLWINNDKAYLPPYPDDKKCQEAAKVIEVPVIDWEMYDIKEWLKSGENDKSENDSVLVREDILQVRNFSTPIRDPRSRTDTSPETSAISVSSMEPILEKIFQSLEKLEGETKRMVKVADRLQHEKIKSTETDGLLDVLPLKMESQLRDFERNAQSYIAKAFPEGTEKECLSTLVNWLDGAKDRDGGRKKRQKNTRFILSINEVGCKTEIPPRKKL